MTKTDNNVCVGARAIVDSAVITIILNLNIYLSPNIVHHKNYATEIICKSLLVWC